MYISRDYEYSPPDYQEQRADLPARMAPPLRKYVQAQRVLCAYVPLESAPAVIVKPPAYLYKQLSKLGYRWVKSRGYWKQGSVH